MIGHKILFFSQTKHFFVGAVRNSGKRRFPLASPTLFEISAEAAAAAWQRQIQEDQNLKNPLFTNESLSASSAATLRRAWQWTEQPQGHTDSIERRRMVAANGENSKSTLDGHSQDYCTEPTYKWPIPKLQGMGRGCSTTVERIFHYIEAVALVPARCWALFSFYPH